MHKSRFLLLVALVGIFASPAHSWSDDDDDGDNVFDTLIVGTGAAGRFAAVMYSDMGMKTVSVDIQNKTGGHCDTYPVPGHPGYVINYGVDDYVDTGKLNRLGIGPFVVDSYKFVTRFVPADNVTHTDNSVPGNNFAADFAHHIGPINTTASNASQQATAAAFARLFQIVSVYPWLVLGPQFFPNPLPANFSGNFADFAVKNNLTAILPSIGDVLLEISGYGSLQNLTVFDGLRAMNKANLLLFQALKLNMDLAYGCKQLYDAITANLTSDRLLLSHRVVSVGSRKENDRLSWDGSMRPIEVHVQKIGSRKLKRLWVHKIVMAIPPVLEDIGFLGPDSREKAVLADMRKRAYFGCSLTDDGTGLLDNTTSFNLINVYLNFSAGFPPPVVYPPQPYVSALRRVLPFGPMACYAAADDSNITTSQMDGVVVSQVDSIPSTMISNPNLEFLIRHDYAPYYTAEALARPQSPYADFDALEDYLDTVWIGAARGGANTPFIWDDTYRVLQRVYNNSLPSML